MFSDAIYIHPNALVFNPLVHAATADTVKPLPLRIHACLYSIRQGCRWRLCDNGRYRVLMRQAVKDGEH